MNLNINLKKKSKIEIHNEIYINTVIATRTLLKVENGATH